jgi:hypothetical protein
VDRSWADYTLEYGHSLRARVSECSSTTLAVSSQESLYPPDRRGSVQDGPAYCNRGNHSSIFGEISLTAPFSLLRPLEYRTTQENLSRRQGPSRFDSETNADFAERPCVCFLIAIAQVQCSKFSLDSVIHVIHQPSPDHFQHIFRGSNPKDRRPEHTSQGARSNLGEQRTAPTACNASQYPKVP